jgi:hypothetical protein
MTFRIHIPVAAMRISGSNPSGTGAWRLFPPACLPTVGIAIPVLVSVDPDVIPARSNGPMLADANRGTKLNYDLGMSGYYSQGKTE